MIILTYISIKKRHTKYILLQILLFGIFSYGLKILINIIFNYQTITEDGIIIHHRITTISGAIIICITLIIGQIMFALFNRKKTLPSPLPSKNKLNITTLLFFILINTSFFWDGFLGIYSIPFSFVLEIVFLIIIVNFFILIFRIIQNKFDSKNKRNQILYIAIVIALTIYKPFGFINLELSKANEVLIAKKEAVSNCNMLLILRDDGTYTQRMVCYSIDNIQGTYSLKNDTIFFKNSFEYSECPKYGLITENSNNYQIIKLYYDSSYKAIPLLLYIEKNNIKQ
jgi:hypothetical protein